MRSSLGLRGILCISFLLLLQWSCKKDDIISPASVSTFNSGVGSVGPSGGVISLPDGASVTIPNGALASNQTITISRNTSTITSNTGCRIYDLKPDGLTFADSVTVTLPYDVQAIPSGLGAEERRVRVMVLYNDEWTFLPTSFSDATGRLTVKTKHFSRYAVSSSSKWSEYFLQHKGDQAKYNQVPYYAQRNSGWCVFYSASMAARFFGHGFKGHYLAAQMNKSIYEGVNLASGWIAFDAKLSAIGLTTERADPPWGNTSELSGYLISKLDAGGIVVVMSQTISHAFVVCGHNSSGFYVNDPSGVFLQAAFGTKPGVYDCEMVLVPYDKFRGGLTTFWDVLGYPEGTITITGPFVGAQNNGPTIDFPFAGPRIRFASFDESQTLGSLDLEGTFQPFGYAFTDPSGTAVSTFPQPCYISIQPQIANSNQTDGVDVKIHYKIDGADVSISPLLNSVPAGNSSFLPLDKQFLLNGLSAGGHRLQIELRSSDGQSVYDSLSFGFAVSASTAVTPLPPTLLAPAEGALNLDMPITFRWTPSIGATSYQLQVSTSSTFSSTSYDQSNLTGISQQISGLSNGTTYYWRVRASNSASPSGWSSVWNFTIASGIVIPPTPTLSSPANGASNVGVPPTLTWNASSGATSYQLQVSTSSTFSSTSYDQSNLTGISQQISGLSNNTTYFWRVRASSSAGPSGWSSPVWSFATGSGVIAQGMVLVTGGTFQMGSTSGYSDEHPVHAVTVSSFYLDAKEVTVAQYRAFCTATGRAMPTCAVMGLVG